MPSPVTVAGSSDGPPPLAAGPSDAMAPSPALVPPPGNPRFPLFDGLRGIAVLGVLVFHVFELTAQVGRGVPGRMAEVPGFEGVIVFFVVSGFLLYRPYVAARASGRPPLSTGRYFRRRALRILPAYWAILTLLAIFPGIVGAFSGDWWRYYGYLQVYASRTVGLGIPVAWSLCVEVAFYLTLPIWALAARRIPAGRSAASLMRAELLPLGVVIVGGTAVQLAAARQLVSHAVASSLVGQCTWLAIGMTLAVASVAIERQEGTPGWVGWLADRPALCWAVSAAAFIGLMWLLPPGGVFGLIALVTTAQPAWQTLARILLEGVLAAFLVFPAIFGDERRGLPRRLLASAPLVWLGVISYSFYLWHLTVTEVIAQSHNSAAFSGSGLGLLNHVHTARPLVLFAVAFVATAVLATVTYRLIELPFLKRKG